MADLVHCFLVLVLFLRGNGERAPLLYYAVEPLFLKRFGANRAPAFLPFGVASYGESALLPGAFSQKFLCKSSSAPPAKLKFSPLVRIEARWCTKKKITAVYL